MTTEERKARNEERKASKARIEQAQAATRAVVATGKCPDCGSGLKRNLSLTGWWTCEQRGAAGFRARADAPACSWQGFTE